MDNGYLCHLIFIFFKFILTNFIFLEMVLDIMVSQNIFLSKMVCTKIFCGTNSTNIGMA